MPQLDHYNFYITIYFALVFVFYWLFVLLATVFLPMLYKQKIS